MAVIGKKRSKRSLFMTGKTTDFAHEVKQVVTFGKERELLRASRISTIMQHGAAILESAEGSAETYELSEPVGAIRMFISHNWAVPRAHKFCCLALHFNWLGALLAALVALLLSAGSTALGLRILVLETPISTTDLSLGMLRHSYNCSLLTAPAFVVALLTGHELKRRLGVQGCTVFLDKTCIHQTDKDIQKRSIRRLGAFLRSSSSMISLYTDLYLTKLWTVYEVACFLSLHSTCHLVMVPTSQPVIIFGGVAISYGSVLLQGLCKLFDVSAYLSIALGLIIFYIPMFAIFRQWARKKALIHQRLAVFQVRDCSCWLEEDRVVVYQNIGVLMRSVGAVRKDASEQETLDAFDEIVRGRLPRSLTASIGPVGIWYRHAVSIFIAFVSMSADIYLLGEFPYQVEWSTRYRFLMAAWWLMFVLGIWPILIFLLSQWCGLWLHLRRCQESVLIATGIALAITLNLVLVDLTHRLLWAAIVGRRRNAYAVGLAMLLASTIGLAVFLFTAESWWFTKEEEEDDEDMETVGTKITEEADEMDKKEEEGEGTMDMIQEEEDYAEDMETVGSKITEEADEMDKNEEEGGGKMDMLQEEEDTPTTACFFESQVSELRTSEAATDWRVSPDEREDRMNVFASPLAGLPASERFWPDEREDRMHVFASPLAGLPASARFDTLRSGGAADQCATGGRRSK